MKTPAESYYQSPRKWDGVLRAPEYDTKAETVRKVCPSGCIWLKQEEYYVGTTLVGEYVGLKEVGDGEYEIHYGPVTLGKIKEGEGVCCITPSYIEKQDEFLLSCSPHRGRILHILPILFFLSSKEEQDGQDMQDTPLGAATG